MVDCCGLSVAMGDQLQWLISFYAVVDQLVWLISCLS